MLEDARRIQCIPEEKTKKKYTLITIFISKASSQKITLIGPTIHLTEP